ncbi:Hypothetical predicted protein [Mytilus galloprovincialis]|uniref:protein-tyrosine-phosphatase n=1 Tax=Mytilus galloprovincialis TaxID=29158 RepID=A0A8B6DW67_MYTGA|nr:Hypothetical predicted protein [Mytilus galloprovincialis]
MNEEELPNTADETNEVDTRKTVPMRKAAMRAKENLDKFLDINFVSDLNIVIETVNFITCSAGFYGSGCLQNCSLNCVNPSCHHTNGECIDGCNSGWKGFNCTQGFVSVRSELQGEYYGTAIGGGIGAMIAVILIMFAGFVIYKDNKKLTKDKYSDQSKSSLRSTLNRNRESNHVHEYVNAAITSDTGARTVRLEATTEETELLHERDTFEHRQIPIENSVNKIHIEKMKEAIIEKQKDEGFEKEYQILPKGLIHAHVEGSNEVNKDKNRFRDLWPYDHSRIVLKGNKKTDYINANYIDNYDKEKAYIATQGPKKNTVRDFWHMIWQENVGKIVMVTQLKEGRRNKCVQYWPDVVNEQMVVENYRLTLTKEKEHTLYVYRLITIFNHNDTNRTERKVHQFHFTQWPDHGVPDSIKLVHFYRNVKSEHCDQNGPMVVHCSAGIGRTGTFIAIDALYENGKKTKYVNVIEYVQMMRKDRMNMIQTHEQYATVFEALLELFTVPNTSIKKSVFCKHVCEQECMTLPKNRKMFKLEFQKLETLRPAYHESKFSAAKSKENISKSWVENILPHDNFRPYLMSYGRARTDYINAVIIPGHREESTFIVTQCPLKDTVVDFWTMIYDHNSRIIVLLDQVFKNAQLWFERSESLEFDNFRITQEGMSNKDELEISLFHKKQHDKRTIKNIPITVVCRSRTKLPPPNDISAKIDYDDNTMLTARIVDNEIKLIEVNAFKDGCTKSGLFVALYLILDKINIDEEVDIFQVVRSIQTRRPEFLKMCIALVFSIIRFRLTVERSVESCHVMPDPEIDQEIVINRFAQRPIHLYFNDMLVTINSRIVSPHINCTLVLFLIMVDASSAFDVVWHASLLKRIFQSGISGQSWQILNDWYTHMSSAVRWEGKLSTSFAELQGVRQGSVWSPSVYKLFVNPLIKKLESDSLGFKIRNVFVGTPMCADDICYLFFKPDELQTMISLLPILQKQKI